MKLFQAKNKFKNLAPKNGFKASLVEIEKDLSQ